MNVLDKPCPRCKGKGKIPNVLLPGRHICRRCEGAGSVPTVWKRLADRALQHFDLEED